MPHINAKSNSYAASLGDLLDATPKSVLAAIAVSALTVGGDYLDEARERLVSEWALLNGADIVPQPVPPRFRNLIKADLL